MPLEVRPWSSRAMASFQSSEWEDFSTSEYEVGSSPSSSTVPSVGEGTVLGGKLEVGFGPAAASNIAERACVIT